MKLSPSRRRRSTDSVVVFSILLLPPSSSVANPLRDHLLHLRGGNALLLQGVAVADRDRTVLHRLTVDRDAEGRADLVLPSVAPADRAGLVVEHRQGAPQSLGELVGELRH